VHVRMWVRVLVWVHGCGCVRVCAVKRRGYLRDVHGEHERVIHETHALEEVSVAFELLFDVFAVGWVVQLDVTTHVEVLECACARASERGVGW
jgi:hypothetical protein